MKPVLKAPGTMLLNLRYHGPLSNVAFNFNLRRYSLERAAAALIRCDATHNFEEGSGQRVGTDR